MSNTTYQAGIYSIICTTTEKFYIGSSKNIHGRCTTHRSDLRRNKHFCSHLQRAWNKYGEDAFMFTVLENVIEPITDAKQLTEIEQIWLDAFLGMRLLFNTRLKAESNCGYTHRADAKTRKTGLDNIWFGKPRSEESRRRMSQSQMGKVASKEKLTKMRKVDFDTACRIRQEYSTGGKSQRALANEHGFSQTVIGNIIHRHHGY